MRLTYLYSREKTNCSQECSSEKENNTKMKSKNSNKDSETPEDAVNRLEKSVETLEGICKTFSFILPPHAKHPSECLTTTELYRVQSKMARQMWVDYINSKNK